MQDLGQRVNVYKELLAEPAPELKREAILGRIIAAREHLKLYPASCAARIRREEAFDELYKLEQESFGSEILEVDQTYRKLSDYVFAPLVYEESKTCCWNQSTANMFDIIMQHAEAEIASQGDACVAPTVFKAYEGDYKLWKAYAESLDRGSEWNEGIEDEACAQRDQLEDIVQSDWLASDYCKL